MSQYKIHVTTAIFFFCLQLLQPSQTFDLSYIRLFRTLASTRYCIIYEIMCTIILLIHIQASDAKHVFTATVLFCMAKNDAIIRQHYWMTINWHCLYDRSCPWLCHTQNSPPSLWCIHVVLTYVLFYLLMLQFTNLYF